MEDPRVEQLITGTAETIREWADGRLFYAAFDMKPDRSMVVTFRPAPSETQPDWAVSEPVAVPDGQRNPGPGE